MEGGCWWWMHIYELNLHQRQWPTYLWGPSEETHLLYAVSGIANTMMASKAHAMAEETK